MSKIGLIIPTRHEFNLIEDEIKCETEYQICGMGKVNAAIAASNLISIFECEKILLVGFAGGLRGLDKGDIIEPSEFIEGDFHAEELEVQYPNSFSQQSFLNLGRKVPIVTQDRFLKEDIYERTILTPVLACDMESYAVAKVCQAHDVEFYCVRIISDIADEFAERDFSKPNQHLIEVFQSTLRKAMQCLESQ